MIIDLAHENIKRGDTTWIVSTTRRISIDMSGSGLSALRVTGSFPFSRYCLSSTWLMPPPKDMNLELALEYIGQDELMEVTPKNIRMRKRNLKVG